MTVYRLTCDGELLTRMDGASGNQGLSERLAVKRITDTTIVVSGLSKSAVDSRLTWDGKRG